MPQRYVSNKNESVRMFESDFMEFFSHVHPATPIVIYLPLMSYMLYLAAVPRAVPLGIVAGLFAAGIVIWSLVEYTMHRWIFHYQPKSKWGQFLHFMLHGVHHDYPNDASRLVMPPVVSGRSRSFSMCSSLSFLAASPRRRLPVCSQAISSTTRCTTRRTILP